MAKPEDEVPEEVQAEFENDLDSYIEGFKKDLKLGIEEYDQSVGE